MSAEGAAEVSQAQAALRVAPGSSPTTPPALKGRKEILAAEKIVTTNLGYDSVRPRAVVCWDVLQGRRGNPLALDTFCRASGAS